MGRLPKKTVELIKSLKQELSSAGKKVNELSKANKSLDSKFKTTLFGSILGSLGLGIGGYYLGKKNNSSNYNSYMYNPYTYNYSNSYNPYNHNSRY